MRVGKNFFIFVKIFVYCFCGGFIFLHRKNDGASVYLSSDFTSRPYCGLKGPFRLLPKGIKKDRIFTI